MSKICVVISQPPTPDPEALEMILALATFDHDVSVIFTAAGIGWLYKNQQARKPKGKAPDKVLAAFPMYDCDKLYYRAADIQTTEPLTTLAEAADDQFIQQLIRSADHCLSF